MDALRIAFDTIIVGALALPWVFFAADLFFLKNPDDDKWAINAWAFVTKLGVPTAVAGVMLFGVTYVLGSAISRTAEDFFNDEELTRVWPTEDNIRTAEYCDQDPNIRATFERDTFNQVNPSYFDKCPKVDANEPKRGTCNYWFGRLCYKYSNDLVSETQQVFRLQEAALLLNGQDRTDRLRQLHYQIGVLRGAAFDGLLALVFCLFCWWARHRTSVRLVLGLVPLLFLALGLYWLRAHFQRMGINDAPFMEVTLILLGVAGLCGLYKAESREWYGHRLFLLLLLFTVVAFLGWWRTEVVYSRQVIDSFYAQRHVLK
jgi:hypothetical protein